MKLAIVLFVGAILTARAATVLEDVERSSVRLRTIRLADSEPFSLKELERRSRLELSRAKSARFVRVLFFPHGGGMPVLLPTHSSFENWRALYESLKSGGREIAELVSIEGNAVLRFRDLSGNVVRVVLAGKDPLTRRVRNHTFELLYFAPGPNERYGNVGFVLYVRSEAPLVVEEGVALLAGLKRALPESVTIELAVRNDEWFALSDMRYPIYNPFLPYGVPPEHQGNPEVMLCWRTICDIQKR